MRPATTSKITQLIWFIPLILVGFLISVSDWRLPQKQTTGFQSGDSVQAQAMLLPQARVDEVFDQGQYQILWSNPRYETDLNLKPYAFMVDLELVNKSFPGEMQMIVNCDRDDITGLGVSFDEHDGFVVLPLETGTQVIACRYTPTGSYDPNLAVEIRF